MEEKKVAVIFSGTGASIGFPAGVVDVLLPKIKPDFFFGVSGGGHIAEIVARSDGANAVKLIGNISSRSDIWGWNWDKSKGYYNAKPLKKLLKNLRTEYPTIHTYCEVGLTNLNEDCLYFLSSDNVLYSQFGTSRLTFFSDLSYATSALPVVLGAQPDPFSKNNVWLDGGVCCNAPLKRAIALGATDIYCVLAFPFPPKKQNNPPAQFLPIVEDAIHSIELALSASSWKDLDLCLERNSLPGYRQINIHLICPQEPLPIGSAEFDNKKIWQCIEIGRQEAEKAIRFSTHADFTSWKKSFTI